MLRNTCVNELLVNKSDKYNWFLEALRYYQDNLINNLNESE